jgi:hypothetical protein
LKRIRNALKVAVPQLAEIELTRDKRGSPHLRGRYEHWRPHGAWQAEDQFSDGTLRLMGLLWSAITGSGPLLLEEPELSLHPEVVRFIKQRIKGYNQAARIIPWLVLLDLNHEFDCLPPLRSAWLPRPSPNMCFRIAVREVEAWLLADRQRFASFFQIAQSTIPTDPKTIDNPKELVVNLAGRSRSRAIKDDMVPRVGSGRSVGPGYISRLIEFAFDVRKGWRPQPAACSSDSLTRCLNRLRELAAKMQ